MYICGFFSSTFSFYLNCSYIKFISAGCSRITLFWTTNSPFFSLVKKITGEKCQICQLGVYISTQLVMYAYICMYVCIDYEYVCIFIYIYFVGTHGYKTCIYVFIYFYTYIFIYTQHSSDQTTYFPIFTFQYETLGKVANTAFGIESM